MGNSPNPNYKIQNLRSNACWNQIGVGGDCSCTELQSYTHCHNCPVYSASGRQLLERKAPTGYLQEWTDFLTRQQEEQAVDTTSVGIFRIGGEWLALPAPLFTEVAEPSPIHTLPHHRNKTLLGIVSIRGEMMLCISLGEILKLEAAPSNQVLNPLIYQRMVVVEVEGNHWAFLVDEIDSVGRISAAELQNVPATIAKAAGTYTKAIANWEGKSVSLLDHELLFYTLNRRIL
ncbi:MAG TPA: chemotaxis protein CheW [Allocoleopsis sp.]